MKLYVFNAQVTNYPGKTMSYIPDFLQPVFITSVEMFWKEDRVNWSVVDRDRKSNAIMTSFKTTT